MGLFRFTGKFGLALMAWQNRHHIAKVVRTIANKASDAKASGTSPGSATAADADVDLPGDGSVDTPNK